MSISVIVKATVRRWRVKFMSRVVRRAIGRHGVGHELVLPVPTPHTVHADHLQHRVGGGDGADGGDVRPIDDVGAGHGEGGMDTHTYEITPNTVIYNPMASCIDFSSSVTVAGPA